MRRLDVFAFGAHVFMVAAVTTLAFTRMSGLLFTGLDGATMLTNVDFQYRLTAPAAGFFADPLQGLGDIWFNFNAWLSPGFLLPALFYGWDGFARPEYRVAVYALHAAFLFLAVVAIARAFNMRRNEALVGAWATILLVFPVYGPPLIYPILQIQPNLSFTIAESYLLLVLFGLIGREHTVFSAWFRPTGLVAVTTIVAGHFLLIAPTSIFITLPFFIAGGFGMLLGACDKREVVVKLVGSLCLVAALALFHFFDFVLGIFRYTAAAEYGGDFENTRMSWYFVSILFQGKEHGWAGPALFIAGALGLLHASLFGERRVRAFAQGGLAYAAIIIGFGTATVFYDFWKGPSPLYFETLIWPVYALFAGRLVLIVFRWLASAAERISESFKAVEPLGAVCRFRSILPLVVPIAFVTMLRPAFPERPPDNYEYPPKSNDIVTALKHQVGVAPGVRLGGRVVTFSLQDRSSPVGWLDLHTIDSLRDRAIGNDLDLVGFWYFGIPTLIAYAPTISPQLYTLSVSLLARRGDHQMRNVLVLREPRLAVLRMLGVTHVVTDGTLGDGFRRLVTLDIPNGETVRLYAVDGTVREAASPTKILLVDSLNEAIAHLRQNNFDPLTEAMLFRQDAGKVNTASLVPATGVEVKLAGGGIQLSAESSGRSLLYIPFQFSHCLRLEPREGGDIRLLRVNGIGTGVLFEHQLEARLVYFNGPFHGARCRLEDLKSYRAVMRERS